MKKFVLIFAVIGLFWCNVFAGGAGTTIFQILNIPVSAYDASLSNINIVRTQNPSIVAGGSYLFNFTQGFHFAETKYSAASANLPLKKNSSLCISLMYFDYGTILKTYSDGAGGYIEAGSFGASDKVFSVSYGLKMSKKLSGGISAKYIKIDIDDVSYSGFAFNVDFIYFVKKNIGIGTGIANFGSKVSGYELPAELYIGIFSDITKKTKLIAQLENYYNDDLYELKIAAETSIDRLMLRIGYDFPLKKQNVLNFNSQTLNNFSFGAGLDFNLLFFDYAWLPEGDLGNIHMFTVGVKF